MQDILHPPRGSNPTVDFLLQSPQLPTYDHAHNLEDIIHNFCHINHIPLDLVTVHPGPRPTLLFIKVVDEVFQVVGMVIGGKLGALQ